MINFDCPHCGKAIKVKDEAAGMKGKCLGCGEVIDIPKAKPSPKSAVPDSSIVGDTQETGLGIPAAKASSNAETSLDADIAEPKIELNTHTRLVKCVDCGKSVSRSASTCPHCGCLFCELPQRAKYPFLVSYAILLYIVAGIVAIGSLVLLFVVVQAWGQGHQDQAVGMAAFAAACGLTASLVLACAAQLILLFIDIENNTSTLRGRRGRKRLPIR